MTTTSLSPLPDLLRRVREATGPSRELDLEIHRALDPHGSWSPFLGITSSCDAVLALIADRLPDMQVTLEGGPKYWRAEIDGEWEYINAPTPALALLAAALKAIIAQEQQP